MSCLRHLKTCDHIVACSYLSVGLSQPTTASSSDETAGSDSGRFYWPCPFYWRVIWSREADHISTTVENIFVLTGHSFRQERHSLCDHMVRNVRTSVMKTAILSWTSDSLPFCFDLPWFRSRFMVPCQGTLTDYWAGVNCGRCIMSCS